MIYFKIKIKNSKEKLKLKKLKFFGYSNLNKSNYWKNLLTDI